MMKKRKRDDQRVGNETERGVNILKFLIPCLSPQALAPIALTCQRLATAVRTLTESREADAAQGMERWAVPVRNDLDACRYPWFHYTPSCCRTSSSASDNAIATAHRWGGESSSGLGIGNQEHDRVGVMRWCQEDLGIFPCSGILGSVGCRCADNCVLAQQNQGAGEHDNYINCTCGRTVSTGLSAYTPESKLLLLHLQKDESNVATECEIDDSNADDDNDVNEEEGPPLILECGGACSCSADCHLRVTQQGLSVRVVVVRQRLTGWGLHAAQHITKGSFVCEYAGELLTTSQSRERQSLYDEESKNTSKCGSALLVVREYMPSGNSCVRLNVDATRAGNVARFINHACDGGNLLPCIIRAAGSVIPRLVLFAREDICEGEELRYSYGSCGGVVGRVLPCFCGTVACFGTLPSDST